MSYPKCGICCSPVKYSHDFDYYEYQNRVEIMHDGCYDKWIKNSENSDDQGSGWGDLKADVRHTVEEDPDKQPQARHQADRSEAETQSDSKPRRDGVGRLIASWGSWREYKGKRIGDHNRSN